MFETGTLRLFKYKISAQPISKSPEGDVDDYIKLVFDESNMLPEIQDVSLQKPGSCGILRLSKFKRDKKKQKVIGENPDYKVVVAELIIIILNA